MYPVYSTFEFEYGYGYPYLCFNGYEYRIIRIPFPYFHPFSQILAKKLGAPLKVIRAVPMASFLKQIPKRVIVNRNHPLQPIVFMPIIV
jgi:hypothetical protein